MVALIAALGACATTPATEPYAWDLPPGFPTPRVPADNPMSDDKVTLGRALFNDTRLSGNGTQSCASCHLAELAFTDGRTTAIGSTGAIGRHNSMSLTNVAYNSSQTWADPTVIDLEAQALVPLFGISPVELGITEDVLLSRMRASYADDLAAAFPDDADPITVTNVARAIASFERTLISGSSRFDRHQLAPQEQRGLSLFESERLGCRSCHGGFNFTVATGDRIQMFNTALYDPYPAHDRGLAEITQITADIGRFKPPTLRNIALTAPYMHDGSLATLDEVIDTYASGGRASTSPYRSPLVTGFMLTPDEKADLVAFLGALTNE
ncbi:MAG: di-heme enzyme [Deltaproteobacteria bacterium]|nr:di-heme enzyme [Deltaproteobacteria bacterium]